MSVNNSLSINGAITVPGAGVNTKTTAFVQKVTQANSNTPNNAGASMIDNPICNGNPNAILIVTANYQVGGIYGANAFQYCVGVEYNNGHWYLMAPDLSGLTVGLAYNVLVIVP